jgi:glycosyltransferase involved in cell wall biosynthesis
LRIAGGGPLEGKVREAAASDSRIEYLGFIPLTDVLQLYKSSDVLVNVRITKDMNTRYFYPGKMMEYLASGTPVITTCTGHTEEEFGDFVYLLRDETPRGLATLIERVAGADPEERKRLGLVARKYMSTHKTWDAQTKKVARFIREVVLGVEVKTSADLELTEVGFRKPQEPMRTAASDECASK